MNGEDLPLAHGYPLRVLVPGCIGSANQKWLNRIWVRDQEHDGPGMTGLSCRVPRFLVAPGAEVADEDMAVLTHLRIKSLITRPETGSEGTTRPMVLPGWNPRGDGHNSTHRIAVTAV